MNRPTKAEAASYFIAGKDRLCQEDSGFATNPWTKVRFENHGFILEDAPNRLNNLAKL